jgi:hypothetical protein
MRVTATQWLKPNNGHRRFIDPAPRPLTDVSAKQYHAGYQAILDRYRDHVTFGCVTNADTRDALDAELRQYQKDFNAFRN